MNCKHCDAPLDQEAQFCPHCGTQVIAQPEELDAHEEEPATAQAQTSTQEKLFLSDQPATEVDLNILHMYNSVPAPQPVEAPIQPEQQEELLLKTQPVPLKTKKTSGQLTYICWAVNVIPPATTETVYSPYGIPVATCPTNLFP